MCKLRNIKVLRHLAEAKRSQQRNGVRYCELLRLPYFDIVRMTITDPMHTFLLGLVQNETKSCLSSMQADKLSQFYNRMRNIKVPYDVGRLPTNLQDKDGLSGLTADQWKNFALIYARPCLAGLVSAKSYECLCLLCEIVQYIVQPVISSDDIAKLYILLHKHHKLFKTIYGKWEVSVNYHMALHIPDIITDFGPSHGYWCFAYERMNGTLTDDS